VGLRPTPRIAGRYQRVSPFSSTPDHRSIPCLALRTLGDLISVRDRLPMWFEIGFVEMTLLLPASRGAVFKTDSATLLHFRIGLPRWHPRSRSGP